MATLSIATASFPPIIFDAFSLAYSSALHHIACNRKCSHHSCVVLVNDQIHYTANNSPDGHAETNVLELLDAFSHASSNDTHPGWRLKGGYGGYCFETA